MTTRKLSFSHNEFYHVYNRGVDKRTIFQDAKDYERFVNLLYLTNSKNSIDLREIKRDEINVYEYERGDELVAIGAYCLMPNHFHLLLTPVIEGGVTKYMNKLCTSYSMYFNKKYLRSGTLFEGKFKAEWADTDQYLKYLYAYIHLNPVKLIQSDWKEQGIADFEKAYLYAKDYRFSSLAHYFGSARPEQVILNTSLFPEYFVTEASMQNELFEWLAFKPKVINLAKGGLL